MFVCVVCMHIVVVCCCVLVCFFLMCCSVLVCVVLRVRVGLLWFVLLSWCCGVSDVFCVVVCCVVLL